MLLDLLYLAAVLISLPYLVFKVLTEGKYRTGFSQRLGFIDERRGKKPCLWVHGSSVGEILTGQTLINRIEDEFPDIDIIISSWTESGVATARKNFKGKYVFHFPLDIKFSIRKVFRRVRPDCIILIELEIWPNFFIMAERYKIPAILVNGRISDKSMKFFRKLSWLSRGFRKSLASNKVYCARTEDDSVRFQKLSIPRKNINLTGTMKFDNIALHEDERTKTQLLEALCIAPNDVVLVGGSTHDGEEKILLAVFNALLKDFANLRLILVPRHIERTAEIVKLVENAGFQAIKRSSTYNDAASPKRNGGEPNSVVIVNTIGELREIYSIADCVFVGRSLVPHGGQNMMEPAGLAKPVIFGPHTFNFKEEAALLLKNDAAKLVHNEYELLNTTRYIISNPDNARRMGLRAQEIVVNNQGATDNTMDIIRKYFKSQGIFNQKECN